MLQEIGALDPKARLDDVPAELRKRLALTARNRLNKYHAEWGTKGLQNKLKKTSSREASPKMRAAFDDFIKASLGAFVPDDFKASRGVQSPELLSVMRKFALAKRAMGRSYTRLRTN